MALPLIFPKLRPTTPVAKKPSAAPKRPVVATERRPLHFHRSSRLAAEPALYSWVQPGGWRF